MKEIKPYKTHRKHDIINTLGITILLLIMLMSNASAETFLNDITGTSSPNPSIDREPITFEFKVNLIDYDYNSQEESIYPAPNGSIMVFASKNPNPTCDGELIYFIGTAQVYNGEANLTATIPIPFLLQQSSEYFILAGYDANGDIWRECLSKPYEPGFGGGSSYIVFEHTMVPISFHSIVNTPVYVTFDPNPPLPGQPCDLLVEINSTATGQLEVYLEDPDENIIINKSFTVPPGKQVISVPNIILHDGYSFLQVTFSDGNPADYTIRRAILESPPESKLFIPEFPTIAVPVAAILGLIIVLGRKKND